MKFGSRIVRGFALGNNNPDIDSIVAAKLAGQSLSAYQAANGLKVDGVIGRVGAGYAVSRARA